MSDEIFMRIRSGLVDNDFTAKIEISSAYKDELEFLLDEAGVEYTEVLPEGSRVESLGHRHDCRGTWTTTSARLHEFLHRHEGKELNVEVNGEKWSAKSVDADGFISMMQRVDEQKRKSEEAWQQSFQLMDEADSEEVALDRLATGSETHPSKPEGLHDYPLPFRCLLFDVRHT